MLYIRLFSIIAPSGEESAHSKKKKNFFGVILPKMFYFCQNVECVKVSLGYKSNHKKNREFYSQRNQVGII